MGKLDGKVAIITGGGRGLGRGFAMAMAKEGAAIVIPEYNEEILTPTIKELKDLGTEALGIVCNVRFKDQVDAAVATAIQEFGTVDILVNNAQQYWVGIPLEEQTEEKMRLTWESGCLGALFFMQACFPYMKEHGGKIINLYSGTAMGGEKGQASYVATKGAVQALSRVAAREWGKYKINVNLISPAAMSPGLEAFRIGNPEKYAAAEANNPLGKIGGDPETDIGHVAVFLASSDSDYITGQTILVDGGSHFN